MVVKLNQINQFKYPISRYYASINGSEYPSYLDKDSLEACSFIFCNFSGLIPKYYEPPTENEKTESSNESDCLRDCLNEDDCVQFVFYDQSCYLKTKLNLLKAISSNYKNATVKSINCKS
jgi:hypothetical protein